MPPKKFVSPFLNKSKAAEAEKETPPKKSESAATSTKEKGAASTSSATPAKKFVTPAKRTISETQTSAPASSSSNDDDESQWQYWQVMHTKRSNKKHKTWDDGFMIIKQKKYILLDAGGKKITEKSEAKTISDWKEGNTLTMSTKEIEFMKKIEAEVFNSGAIFLNLPETKVNAVKDALVAAPKLPKFKGHKNVKAEVVERPKTFLPTPKDAIVLNVGHPERDPVTKKQMTDVYIDSFLARELRPHQVEGIKFMYECVMGQRDYHGQGCLLADEMGLGKTLQAISLIYVLTHRGPIEGEPIANKVIIVTNSSLVQNWNKEFKKWTGDKLQPLVCSSKGHKSDPSDKLKTFKTGYKSVLIISYNLCTLYADLLHDIKTDLLICDEGHKLKNNSIKIYKSLKEINTKRRIILSGTPLQNDLNEFFCIIDFINPGLLNGAASFKNIFSDPINRSREPAASASEKKLGMARSQQLTKLTTPFILRRTNALLTAHLPPRKVIYVFCKMTELQQNLYKHFIHSKFINRMLTAEDQSNCALACIQNLKKLLTHPNLVYKTLKRAEGSDSDGDEKTSATDDAWQGAMKHFPEDYDVDKLDMDFSGKMKFLENLLKHIKEQDDRVVLVSNYTSILNEMQVMCRENDWSFVRLDGSTNSDKRLEIVDAFNNPASKDFIFLLSSKAGGAGLNLIGANRLILFDPDWNPSTDEQAMGRVWRDGQKKPVFIYRMITTGTIEEKILQRQIVKKGLSKTVVDEKSMKAAFSKEVLRQIFNYNEETICETFKEEAEKGDGVDDVEPVDEVLYSAIIENDIVTFVKVSQEQDDDAYKLTLDDDNIAEDEENQKESQVKNNGDGEEEYKFEEETTNQEEEQQNADKEEDEEPPAKRQRTSPASDEEQEQD